MRYFVYISLFCLIFVSQAELANRVVLKGLAVATLPVDCVLKTEKETTKDAVLDLNSYIEQYSSSKFNYIFTTLNRRLETSKIEFAYFKRIIGKRKLLIKSSTLDPASNIVFETDLYNGNTKATSSARLYKKDEKLVLVVIESQIRSARDFTFHKDKLYKNFKVLTEDFDPLNDAYVSDRVKILDHKFEPYQAKAMAKELNLKDVALRYNIPYPLPELKLTVNEVIEKAKKLSEEDANKLYPIGPKEVGEIETSAKLRYPLYKVGDQVTLKIERGGVAPVVVGTLKGFTQSGVKIGNRLVSNLDLTQEQFALFDAKLNEKYRKNYFRTQLQDRRYKRLSYMEDQVKGYLEKLYKSSSYVFHKSKKKWMSYQEYFLPYERRAKKIFLRKNSKRLRIEFYTSLGYGVLYDQSGARWEKMSLTIPMDDFKNFSKPNFTYEDVTPIKRTTLYDTNF